MCSSDLAGESEYVIAPPLEEVIAARKAEKKASNEHAEEDAEQDPPPDSEE